MREREIEEREHWLCNLHGRQKNYSCNNNTHRLIASCNAITIRRYNPLLKQSLKRLFSPLNGWHTYIPSFSSSYVYILPSRINRALNSNNLAFYDVRINSPLSTLGKHFQNFLKLQHIPGSYIRKCACAISTDFIVFRYSSIFGENFYYIACLSSTRRFNTERLSFIDSMIRI